MNNDLTIAITTDVLGQGERELGQILMKSYIYSLTECEPLPKTVIFVNSGINLTMEDSPVLDSLKNLVEKGVDLFVCGTCLNYYNLNDKLAVGVVSNMYDTVEAMNGSSNTIVI